MATNLEISASLLQTFDPNSLLLVDTTPLYSAATPTGWNNAATDYIENVSTVYLNNLTFYGAPANVAPLNLGNVELMPSPDALPYVLNQAYVLTPALLGVPNFSNGLFTFDYTIQVLAYYQELTITTVPTTTNTIEITDNGATIFNVFKIGDIITNTSTSELLGTVTQIVATGAGSILRLYPNTGHTATATNVLTNGTSNATLGGFGTTITGQPNATFANFNYGDTVVRTGEVLIHRPSLILPPNIPQFEGFNFEGADSYQEETMINFLMVRGITLPSMKYDNKISSLDVFEGKMDDAIGVYGNRLQREENTSAGLLCGPDDVWQFSLLIFICSQIVKNSSTDIRRLLDEYRKRND